MTERLLEKQTTKLIAKINCRRKINDFSVGPRTKTGFELISETIRGHYTVILESNQLPSDSYSRFER